MEYIRYTPSRSESKCASSDIEKYIDTYATKVWWEIWALNIYDHFVDE